MADQPPGGGPEPPPGAIRGRVRPGRIVPYATGALVALVAVLLWSALVPGTPPLTQHDVDDTVAKALASVTPAPAFSEQVYAAVRPSLVLIETKQPKPKGATGSDNGLGSGVDRHHRRRHPDQPPRGRRCDRDQRHVRRRHALERAGHRPRARARYRRHPRDPATQPRSCPPPSAIPGRSTREARRTPWAIRSASSAR